MNTYLLLFFAIILEVCGTMLLPASQNFTKIAPTIILMTAYAFSFYLFKEVFDYFLAKASLAVAAGFISVELKEFFQPFSRAIF